MEDPSLLHFTPLERLKLDQPTLKNAYAKVPPIIATDRVKHLECWAGDYGQGHSFYIGDAYPTNFSNRPEDFINGGVDGNACGSR